MKKTLWAFVVLVCIAVTIRGQEKANLGDSILKDAKEIAGRTTSARRTYIESIFESKSIKYQRRPWQTVRAKGVNLELSFGPKDGKATLYTAHFDVRRASDGANNNASGCAVLMHLVEVAMRKAAAAGNTKHMVFVFLDGGESRSAGSKAYCEVYEGEQIQAAYNFDLCGHGDHLMIGPKMKPFGNSAVTMAIATASSAKVKIAAYDNFLPGDHRIFANYGLDSATISVMPAAQIPQFKKRFALANRSAPLPPFFQDAIRGRDEKKGLQKQALALSATFGAALIHQDCDGGSPGLRLVKDLKKKQKELLALFEDGEFDAKREAIKNLGFNGTIDFILRYGNKTPEMSASFESLIPRLFGGKELRAAIKNVLEKGKECPAEQMSRLKQKIVWDDLGQYYKCMP